MLKQVHFCLQENKVIRVRKGARVEPPMETKGHQGLQVNPVADVLQVNTVYCFVELIIA